MGLMPPVGVVGPACRRGPYPRVTRASMIRFWPLLPVCRPASAPDQLPFAWCREKLYDLKMFHTAPTTIHNYVAQIPTAFNDLFRLSFGCKIPVRTS